MIRDEACSVTKPTPGRYFESVSHMSWIAFHAPLLCFFHTHTYLPFPLIVLPLGLLSVALANKLARIAWAVWKKEGEFTPMN
jgi:hypothetical protein